MAKNKYPWSIIKADIELGKTKAYIHKKYEVPHNTLSMKCKREGWDVVNSEAEALRGFRQSCEQISEVVHNAEEFLITA